MHAVCTLLVQELGIYGRLRKISRCGPVSMFRRAGAAERQRVGQAADVHGPGAAALLLHGNARLDPCTSQSMLSLSVCFHPCLAACRSLLGQWRDCYSPADIAEKVKHFFK